MTKSERTQPAGLEPADEPTLAERLIPLQTLFHRQFSANNSDEKPGLDQMQEGLEAAQRLLAWLQEAVQVPGHNVATASMIEDHTDITVSFITVQQVFTCYSYVLVLLDRAVGRVTSRSTAESLDEASASGSGREGDPLAFRLGPFNLASQPALNTEMVLHLALRLVQHLGVQIQNLASRCEDLTAAAGQTSADSSRWHKEFAAPAAAPPPIPAGVLLHAVSGLVIERERLLLRRLSSLTGSNP